jgi:4a-hydroxytetrahydrobiopterin dehydratase
MSARSILQHFRRGHLQHSQPQVLLGKSNSRRITTTTCQMAPKFLADSGSDGLESDIDRLLSTGWTLTSSEAAIEKTYYLKTYTKVLDLHHLIGVASKAKNHHATMVSKHGSLKVTWTTHEPAPGGLGKKDVTLARWCDEQAKLIGTVEKSEGAKCGPEAP